MHEGCPPPSATWMSKRKVVRTPLLWLRDRELGHRMPRLPSLIMQPNSDDSDGDADIRKQGE